MITTEWERYDPALHSQCSGDYMFLVKPFHHAPYYAGKAIPFKGRFGKHEGLFKDGLRTFMRPLFISEASDTTHAGFAASWNKANPIGGAGPDHTRIYVARKETDPADLTINAECCEYWLNDVVLLICQTATNECERRLIEASVQEDIMLYYQCLVGHRIKWKFSSNSRRESWLVGDRPGGVPSPAPAILYSWSGSGNAVGSCDFFRGFESKDFRHFPKSTPSTRTRRGG
jgi:hypothetical protein